MEKKIIYEEISRIHEMMGLKTQKHRFILNEGGTRALIGNAAEEFAETGNKAAMRGSFKTAVEDWAEANNLLRGGRATFDQAVEAGQNIARVKYGLDAVSEAEALGILARETGGTGLKDFTSKMMKLQLQAASQDLNTLTQAETRAATKRSLQKVEDATIKLKDEFDAGTLDLPALKTKLEALETVINNNRRVSQEYKDAVLPEIQKLKGTVEDFTSDSASVPSANAAVTEIGDFIPAIKAARDLEQQTADAAAEAERRAQENAAQEAINAEKARIQKEFDNVRGAVKGDIRMGKKGFGGPLGLLPSWLGNDAKKSVMNIVNQLEEQYKAGTVTRQQILDRADAELNRLVQIARSEKSAKANELTWLNSTMKKYPKMSWAIIIIAFASLGGITYTYRFAKDVRRQVELEDARQDIMDCFAGVESFEALDSDQKTKFSKIFNCRNRMQDEYPDSYITDIKYVKEEEGAPAEFIVTVGLDPNKVKKHYNANTGDEISTKPVTPKTTTSSKTVSDFETWLKNYATQIGYTYVDGSAKDLGNDSFEGKIKYGTSEAPIQRKWDGTNWVQ